MGGLLGLGRLGVRVYAMRLCLVCLAGGLSRPSPPNRETTGHIVAVKQTAREGKQICCQGSALLSGKLICRVGNLAVYRRSSAIAAVPKIKLAGLNPQSIEFMERDIVDSSAEYTGNKIIPTVVDGNECGAYILVTLDGNDEDEIFQRAETLAEIGEEAGAFDTLVIEHPADKAAVWAARSAFLTVIEAETEHLDEMDVVVPVDKIAEFLGFIHDTGVENDVLIRSFGHAGDGNLHIYCCGNNIERETFLEKSTRVMHAAYAKCNELGGQVSGEHGIGHAKKEYLRESVGDTAFSLMSGIKQVFDPKGILNPGKVCN